MKTGDKVWFINDLGRRVDGMLVERNEVVEEAQADKDLAPTDFQDVSYWIWDVKATDGKTYCAKEDDIKVVLAN